MKNKVIYRYAILLLSTSLVTLQGCSTINPFTNEQQMSKTAGGAMIGSVIGAIIGAASADREDRKERALKGAGIGAIAGGGVGFYMDQQEAKLRQKLQGSGVSVTRDGDNIILNMPGNVTFDTGSYSLNPQFFDVMDSVVLVLNEFDATLVNIAGHTDSVGSNASNQMLSQQRSSTVALYLEKEGTNIERLASMGYGEAFPIASNDTAEGRSLNRRVEITLDPITQ